MCWHLVLSGAARVHNVIFALMGISLFEQAAKWWFG